MTHHLHHTLKPFQAGARQGRFYSLPELAKTYPNVNRLPVAMRIVLESVLRNCDGQKVTEAHVEQLANWQPNAERVDEIPFVVARVVLQDFTGVPLLADLAAMRNVAARFGKDPKRIEPLGARGPSGRPLGDDRSLRQQGGARSEHAARIPA